MLVQDQRRPQAMEESQADLALSLKDHLEKLALRLDLARSERALAWRAWRLDGAWTTSFQIWATGELLVAQLPAFLWP